MSLLTLTGTITGGYDPDYYAGRADAHDEHAEGATLSELQTRSDVITALHPSGDYASGYAYRVAELHREHSAAAEAQTDVAHSVRAA